MSTYDSWLLRGSDDFPPDEPTLREIARAARKSPYEFCIEGDERGTYMIQNPARRCKGPASSRAVRLNKRIFRRLNKQHRSRQAIMDGIAAWLE